MKDSGDAAIVNMAGNGTSALFIFTFWLHVWYGESSFPELKSQLPLDVRKSKRIPEKHLLLLH